jgi:hypothetical protein
VLADKRVQRIQPSAEQKAMLARIRRVLGSLQRRPARSRHANGSGTRSNSGRKETNASRDRKPAE